MIITNLNISGNMKKTQCFSVRLESLFSISDKAYKARSYDGSEDILPKSCVFGKDHEVKKSDAYWIASWILPKKKIQYSTKKEAWFDAHGKRLPAYSSVRYKPNQVEPVLDNSVKELER